MFTDAAIVNHRGVLEDIRGEDPASELCCRSWDFLEGIDLEWAIRNESWFLPYFKQCRVMFCDAFTTIFGELGNLGQQSKGTSMGAQMAFGTKKAINYQGSIPSDKMDEGNQSVLYMMRDMIYKAFRDGGTVSDEWTMDAAFKVAQACITFFDWSLLCCEGDENDVNGTSWDTMKSQLKKRGGLMLWRMFAVINSGWYSIEYHIESGGKQFQLLEASSRTMELSHGRTTDEVLSNKLIQIFPLCHANAQEIWMSNRIQFSYERLLKLDENLARFLQPLVGTTIPDGNDKLVLHQNDFNYFIKLANLDGLFPDQIEEVYDLDEILKTFKLALEVELRSAAQAITNGNGTIRDLALILVSENKLIENCMSNGQIPQQHHTASIPTTSSPEQESRTVIVSAVQAGIKRKCDQIHQSKNTVILPTRPPIQDVRERNRINQEPPLEAERDRNRLTLTEKDKSEVIKVMDALLTAVEEGKDSIWSAEEQRHKGYPSAIFRRRESNRVYAQATRDRKKHRNEESERRINELRNQQLSYILAIAGNLKQDDTTAVVNPQITELLKRRSLDNIRGNESISVILPKLPPIQDVRERNRLHAQRSRDKKNMEVKKMKELIEQLESENALLSGHAKDRNIPVIFLGEEERAAKQSGKKKKPRAKQKRKLCQHDGCSNIATSGGLCIRHQPNRRECSHDGCRNGAQEGRDFCGRHGKAYEP